MCVCMFIIAKLILVFSYFYLEFGLKLNDVFDDFVGNYDAF